MITIIRRIH